MDYEKIVQGTDKLKRGIVWCTKCGNSQRTNSAKNLQSGWPKCCGNTMTIDSPEERAHPAKPQ